MNHVGFHSRHPHLRIGTFQSRMLAFSFLLGCAVKTVVTKYGGAERYQKLKPLMIGLIAGVIVVGSVVMFDKIKIDDPVGAISVHLVCGIWGTLAVGIFSTNPAHTVLKQLAGIGAYGAFAAASAFAIFCALKLSVGLRVSEEEERDGLDYGEHEMHSYELQVGVPGASAVTPVTE